jgi:hypothetical protein
LQGGSHANSEIRLYGGLLPSDEHCVCREKAILIKPVACHLGMAEWDRRYIHRCAAPAR